MTLITVQQSRQSMSTTPRDPDTHPLAPQPPSTFSTALIPHPSTSSPSPNSDDENDGSSPPSPSSSPPNLPVLPSSTASSLLPFSYSPPLSHISAFFISAFSFFRLFFTFQVILDPFSTFKKLWDYIIIIIILYNAFIIPYYIAFDVALSSVLLPFDIICTISMAIDIMVTLRTGFIDFSGNTCYDSWAIAKRYWTRGLILDLIGTFPMDIFSSLVVGYGQRYANLLKAPGLLRASRLAYNDRLAAFNSPTARIIKLMFGFFYLAHLFGAVFFFVGSVESVGNNWIDTGGYRNASLTTQYIASLYWALTTMVTVGYGDIVPVTVYEQAVVIPILMLSALIYATIFGNMAYAIETITSTIRRYQNRMDMVKEFIKVYEIPVELQRKLFDYTNAMWNQNKGFEIEAMLAHLPTSVKAEVMLHINESLIQRVPLLKQCSDRFLEAIILRMSSQVCLAGDYIFKEGDKSREMYFVRTGSVEIIMEDENGVEQVIADIHSFSDCPFFGEISLLLGETRTASAKATTKCVLSSLSQEDFFEVLSMFPDEENSLRETASARLQNDIDREQAALQKKREEEGHDEEEEENGKKKASMSSGGGAVQQMKSKHETRLNALEMTTLGSALGGKERKLSIGGMGQGMGAVGGERRTSLSKSGMKGVGRMTRLQGGPLTRHSSRLDDETPSADIDNPPLAGTSPPPLTHKSIPSMASASLPHPLSSSEPSELETSEEELETRMDHQRALQHQLDGPTTQRGLHHRASSVAGVAIGGQDDLERMRTKRDLGELREKERGMEKAQLEMEEKVKLMENQITEMKLQMEHIISLLAASGQAASTPLSSHSKEAGVVRPVTLKAKRSTGGLSATTLGAIQVKPSPMTGAAVMAAGTGTGNGKHPTYESVTSLEFSTKSDEG